MQTAFRKLWFTGVVLFNVLMLTALPTTSWAGGVVEEFTVAPNALVSSAGHTSQHRLKNHTHKIPQNAIPHTKSDETKKKNGIKLVSLFYDPIKKTTTIRWRAATYEGKYAVSYQIYRWTTENPTQKLIAKVAGNVFKYVDTTRQCKTEYHYKIVGIYKINGIFQAWQYPTLSRTKSTSQIEQSTPSPMAIGCQLSPSGNSSPSWLLILLLPLLFSSRKAQDNF